MLGRVNRLRSAAVIGVVIASLALSGCLPSIRDSNAPDLEQAIPEALLAADLGIADASASHGTDGLTSYVTTIMAVPGGELGPDDLRTILRIVAEGTNISNVSHLRLTAVVGDELIAGDDPFADREYLDLSALADQAGVEWSSPREDEIVVDWDAVVEGAG